MKINYYELNAFSKLSNGGNPAAVVLDSDNLSKNIMQKIAGYIIYNLLISYFTNCFTNSIIIGLNTPL